MCGWRLSGVWLAAMLVVLLGFSGCMPGRLLGRCDLRYRDKSVRWIYKNGCSVQTFGLIVYVAPDRFYELRAGDDCVLVTEGSNDSFSTFSWEKKFALDLRSGKYLWGKGKPIDLEQEPVLYPDLHNRTTLKARIGKDIELELPKRDGRRYSGEVFIRRLGPPARPRVKLFVGPPNAVSGLPDILAIRYPDDLLVVQINRMIACVDLKAIP